MNDTPKWHFGNAAVDGAERRGWLIGAFMEPDDVRMTNDVEIKWGVHAAGDRREAWFEDEQRTTLLILVSGRFRIDLSVGTAVLAEQGDYAMWGPHIGHSLARRGRLCCRHRPLAGRSVGGAGIANIGLAKPARKARSSTNRPPRHPLGSQP